MEAAALPDEVAARLGRYIPWWKLLDNPELSGTTLVTREASSFAQKLSKFRVAVVPDPRIDEGGIKGDTLCLAFRVVACVRHVTHDYAAAKMQLNRDLAFLMVKGRPSVRELNWVRNKGFDAFRLDGETRERLLAWLELLLQAPIENAEGVVRAIGADKSIPWRGDQYARYRALCEADGPLDALEYQALELVKQDQSIAMRRQLSIFDAPADAPTRNLSTAPVLPIPRTSVRTLALMLDEQRIADISKQTLDVGQLLGQVFSDEAASQEAPLVALVPAGWRAALELAARHGTWQPSALFTLWQQHDWMPQALFDDLNERALDACGELLLEGEDLFELNVTALTALRALA